MDNLFSYILQCRGKSLDFNSINLLSTNVYPFATNERKFKKRFSLLLYLSHVNCSPSLLHVRGGIKIKL
jgi:hypothetical protein